MHTPEEDAAPSPAEETSTETDNKENHNPRLTPVHVNKRRDSGTKEPAKRNKRRVTCELNLLCGFLPETEREYRSTDFEFGELIGSGKYGSVYRAKDLTTNRDVAIKRIDVECDGWPSVDRQFRREVEIQGNIRHPNIVRLYGSFLENNRLYLALEYAERGSLFDHIETEGVMTEPDVASCMRSLASAVQHLHSHGVMHRDIKPENILFDGEGNPKLADFGWSVLAPDGRQSDLCGTVDYLAPEMISGKRYDHRVDVWSLGVLCYELLFGAPPFVADSFADTTDRIKRNDFTFPSFRTVSKDAKNFIEKILVPNPNKRMSLREILKHPFLDGEAVDAKSSVFCSMSV